MAKQRVKLDYNNLMAFISNFLNENCSEDNENDAFSIGVGLNLLTAYMKNIAERAIEINDDVLIDLLKDLYVLKEGEDNAEK